MRSSNPDRLKYLKPLVRFEYYITERFRIRQRRQAGKPREQWTRDPILSTYKFTNVRRAWDYTSEWLTTNWYTPHGQTSSAGVAAAVARFICHVPSLDLIGFPGHYVLPWLERSMKTLDARAHAGHKVFTSAYMIAGSGSAGRSKVEWVFSDIIAPVHESKLLRKAWMGPIDELHASLQSLKGWGDFMTQEVVLDLQETFVLSHKRPEEKRMYGWAGPGAIRGLNRIAERPYIQSLNRMTARDEMVALYQHILARDVIPYELSEVLTVHDIEFSLCEFDKYERTLWEQGTPKMKFVPRSTGEETLL